MKKKILEGKQEDMGVPKPSLEPSQSSPFQQYLGSLIRYKPPFRLQPLTLVILSTALRIVVLLSVPGQDLL